MRRFNDDHDLEEEIQPKKKFRLFGNIYNKDGPGVEKGELKAMENPTLGNFFKLFGRKIGRLVSLNFLYVLCNFPIIFFFIQMTGFVRNEFSANAYSVFPVLYGTSLFEPDNPGLSSLLGVFGKVTTGYAHTTASIILMILSFLVIFTFGISNAGSTYILRNMVREEPVFLWADFKYAIKRNWKQALPMGIIDIVLMVLLVYDIIWFNANAGGGMMMTFMLIFLWALLIMYFFMRLYIYLMMVTFDLKLTKIFKNALFFAVLGFKRNVMALIGIALLALITFGLFIMVLPVGIIVPFIILFSLGGFIGTYAAYPKIKQIMIDPYYAEHPDETPPDSYGEITPADDDI